MTVTIKIAEAKAHFSALIARAEGGEEFVIARGNIPVARIMPLGPKAPRRPGVATHWAKDPAWAELNASLLEPLDAQEQAAADGELTDAFGITRSGGPLPAGA